MPSVDERLADWFLVTAEVLSRPIAEFPVEEFTPQILDSFHGSAFTSNLRDRSGSVRVKGFNREAGALGGLDADQAIAELFRMMDIGHFDYHPLLRWYAMSGMSAPQTTARVPSSMVGSWQTKEVCALLRTFDVAHQLSIPLYVNGREHQAIVVTRPSGADFSDDDIQLAARVQPMLSALQRQAEILASREISVAGRDVLTGRELAVLRCVARGMTTHAVGYELAASPRTVEKHLENAYRKLGVHDKVSAVLVARELGLIDSGWRKRKGHAAQT